jgi:hypothetical protein
MGDFANIKFGDSIIEVPEAFYIDKEVINRLRYLQMIDTELFYQKYLQLREVAGSLPTSDEVIAMFNDMKNKTLTELNQIMNKEN